MQIVVGIMVLMAPPLAEPEAVSSWHADYGVALAETKQQHRPLLVVIEDGTQAELQLEQVAFDSEWNSGADLKNYILCRVDVSTPYGKRVAEAFHATSFPHTAIIDGFGRRILYSHNGQIPTKVWQATLNRNRSGQCFT